MPDFTAPSARTADDDTAYGDPELDGLTAGSEEEGSDLDDLKAELGATERPTVTIRVPQRPRYSVRCRLDFTGKELDGIRKKAKDRKFSDGIDGPKFAALLIAITCVDILRDGKPLAEALGIEGPVTFTTRPLQALMETAAATETARKLFALDGDLDAAAQKVLRDAGWGDEAAEADPTE